jgi:drug/metabolite transporter (DMT)-like permease
MLHVGAAVAAAIAINAGYVVQHGGLSTAPAIAPRRPLASVAALLRSRRWLAGAALGYAGLGLELMALAALPLSTVQATIGAGLVVVAVLSRAFGRARLGRSALLGAALAIAALVVLALVTPAQQAVRPSPAPWALAGAAAVVAGAAALVARRLPSATGLALASGLLDGMTSIAMAALAPMLVGTSPALGVAAVAVPIGALVTVAGFLSFQRALQRGRPLAVVTAMMAAMDVVGIGGGIVVLGDPLAAGVGARAAQLAALALAALSAVVVLADRRELPVAEEAPGLLGGRDPELRSGIGRVGPRPLVRAADEPQVLDCRPVAAPSPVEA